MDISALDQRVATPKVALQAGLSVIALSAVLANARETITNIRKITHRKCSKAPRSGKCSKAPGKCSKAPIVIGKPGPDQLTLL